MPWPLPVQGALSGNPILPSPYQNIKSKFLCCLAPLQPVLKILRLRIAEGGVVSDPPKRLL